MSNNIIDLGKFRQDRAQDEVSIHWTQYAAEIKDLSEPVCFLAAGFSTEVWQRMTGLSRWITKPEIIEKFNDDHYLTFNIASTMREWLSRGGYATYDDIRPETWAVFEFHRTDLDMTGVPANWNYRAIEVFFAHMTQISEDFQADAMNFLEIVNAFDKNGWSMVENNLKHQDGNGLIVKVGKRGYGHVVITLHYRRLVDDWKEFERATASIPEDE